MKVLFISGDSDNRVHAREWKVPKRKYIDWDKEFLKCLDHYEANGHYVARGFNALESEFPVDERRILTIEISGYFNFIGDHDDE